MFRYCRNLVAILVIVISSITTLKGVIPLTNSFSREATPSWYIGARYYLGYTLSPYERISNLEAHTMAGELLVSRATFGKNKWEQIHAYPRIGIALDYINLGKPDLTGQAIALIPHMRWAFIKSNNTEIGLRFGIGGGYLTKTFNINTDYKNKAISTPVNAAIQLNGEFTQRLCKNLELNAGLGLTHFSNGSWRLPNSGLNVPAVFVGLNYIMCKTQVFVRRPVEELMPPKKTYFYAYSALSFETRGWNRDRHYTIYSLSACYGKQVSPISKLGIGFDFFYDPTIITDAVDNIIPSKNINDNLQGGIKIEHELTIGKLGFISNFGVYVYHRSPDTGPVYQILGLKYNVRPHVFCGVFLKTFFASADFFQMAVGMNF